MRLVAEILWALRVKGAAVRLAAWTAMLCGSLAIPLLMPLLPPVALPVMASKKAPVEIRAAAEEPLTFGMAVDHGAPPPSPVEDRDWHIDWPLAAVGVYGAVAGFLLLRLLVGLEMSLQFPRTRRWNVRGKKSRMGSSSSLCGRALI
jgi:hypothetical protein